MAATVSLGSLLLSVAAAAVLSVLLSLLPSPTTVSLSSLSVIVSVADSFSLFSINNPSHKCCYLGFMQTEVFACFRKQDVSIYVQYILIIMQAFRKKYKT